MGANELQITMYSAFFLRHPVGAFCRKKLTLGWVTDEDVQHAFGVLKTNGVGHAKTRMDLKCVSSIPQCR